MNKEIIKELKNHENEEKIRIFKKFFKTGIGEYGEGDEFLGLSVPLQRTIAKKYWKETSLEDIKELLSNKYHEVRLTALIILLMKYEKIPEDRDKIKEFYINNLKGINNWDLVDISAPKILGRWALENPKGRRIMVEMADSKNLWIKRIGIVSTYELIRNHEYKEAIEISKKLLGDKHDLIHKAVGWMLREIGKRNKKVLEKFLEENINGY